MAPAILAPTPHRTAWLSASAPPMSGLRPYLRFGVTAEMAEIGGPRLGPGGGRDTSARFAGFTGFRWRSARGGGAPCPALLGSEARADAQDGSARGETPMLVGRRR